MLEEHCLLLLFRDVFLFSHSHSLSHSPRLHLPFWNRESRDERQKGTSYYSFWLHSFFTLFLFIPWHWTRLLLFLIFWSSSPSFSLSFFSIRLDLWWYRKIKFDERSRATRRQQVMMQGVHMLASDSRNQHPVNGQRHPFFYGFRIVSSRWLDGTSCEQRSIDHPIVSVSLLRQVEVCRLFTPFFLNVAH